MSPGERLNYHFDTENNGELQRDPDKIRALINRVRGTLVRGSVLMFDAAYPSPENKEIIDRIITDLYKRYRGLIVIEGAKTPESVEVEEWMEWQYVIAPKFNSYFDILLKKYGDLGNLRGKRILDVGCGNLATDDELAIIRRGVHALKEGRDPRRWSGSIEEELAGGFSQLPDHLMWINYESGTISRRFEPWFCRLLLELGAKPVGIDIGNLEGEQFEHHRADLVKENALAFLPDHSFDGVFSDYLFNSPMLRESHWRRGASDPLRRDCHPHITALNNVKRELPRLLKEDGIIIKFDETADNAGF
ncbi:MAG: hypothetical protein WC734_03265 [Patescibacteria group bacterium]